MTVGMDAVNEAFRALLGRPAESEAVVETHSRAINLGALIASIVGSLEYQNRTRPGPLWNYTAVFDPIPLILKYENHERKALEGHRTNYLGVAVNVDKFFPSLKLGNGLEPVPIPANWHTDIAELAAVLRAVENAGKEFSMIELGCGWGCWMNISGAAARMRDKTLYLMGVEGDEGHVAFAHESMGTNGFDDRQYRIYHGVAAANAGKVFFPRQATSGRHWGLEPIFRPDPDEEARLRAGCGFDELDIIPLEALCGERNRIDLLHIDIQGGETALICEALPLLNQKVAYMVVGTHSRAIDGAIIDMLTADGGWSLEIERPTVFTITGHKLTTRIDGVQGWRNNRL